METALEHILTHSNKQGMLSYMDANPQKFDELLQLAVANKQPYSWRASWLLWSFMEYNDSRIRKYLPEIIQNLSEKRDNQQRELLKVLHQMELDEEQEGILLTHCIKVWESTKKQASIRFNAFRMMVIIYKKYPELAPELKFLLGNQYTDSLSPGVRRSILKTIKKQFKF